MKTNTNKQIDQCINRLKQDGYICIEAPQGVDIKVFDKEELNNLNTLENELKRTFSFSSVFNMGVKRWIFN